MDPVGEQVTTTINGGGEGHLVAGSDMGRALPAPPPAEEERGVAAGTNRRGEQKSRSDPLGRMMTERTCHLPTGLAALALPSLTEGRGRGVTSRSHGSG